MIPPDLAGTVVAVWGEAGRAWLAGLPALLDPGGNEPRVDELFNEWGALRVTLQHGLPGLCAAYVTVRIVVERDLDQVQQDAQQLLTLGRRPRAPPFVFFEKVVGLLLE